jgi:hypothetical protein
LLLLLVLLLELLSAQPQPRLLDGYACSVPVATQCVRCLHMLLALR